MLGTELNWTWRGRTAKTGAPQDGDGGWHSVPRQCPAEVEATDVAPRGIFDQVIIYLLLRTSLATLFSLSILIFFLGK
jgi:hypothetical protein